MERKKWVNLRGLAVIAVIATHVTAGEIYPIGVNGTLNLVLNQLSRFAVPTFLFHLVMVYLLIINMN